MHESLKVLKRELFNGSEINPDTKCWEWGGMTNGKSGYGQIYLRIDDRRQSVLTHVVAACINANIPYSERPNQGRGTKITASHLCGNRICCNPKHVVFETRSENLARSRDSMLAGRKRLFADPEYRRNRIKPYKVTYKQIKEICRLDAKGLKRKVIAKKLGLAPQHVSAMLIGKVNKYMVEQAREELNLQ